MIMFLGALLAILAKAGGMAAKGGMAAAKGAASAGKGALPALQQAGGSIKGAMGANIPGAGGGQGGPLLQGLFDAIGGTKAQAPGKLGQIASAQKPGNMGLLGNLRSLGAQGLQSGLKNQVAGMGGGGGAPPKQAGGISFPSVPGTAPGMMPEPLPPMEMPDRTQLSALRQQILQELLSGQGGGGF